MNCIITLWLGVCGIAAAGDPRTLTVPVTMVLSNQPYCASNVAVWSRRIERPNVEPNISGPGRVVLTDSNGAAKVTVEVGRTNLVRVMQTEEQAWYGEARVYVPESASNVDAIVIGIEPCRGLRGRVADKEGRGVTNFPVLAIERYYCGEAQGIGRTNTAQDGAFLFPLLAERGEYIIGGHDERYYVPNQEMRTRPGEPVRLLAKKTREFEAQGPKFRVQVVDASGGRVAAGVRGLWFSYWDSNMTQHADNNVFTVDDKGTADIPFFPDRYYDLRCVEKFLGKATFKSTDDVATQGTVHLKVTPRFEVKGRLLDGDTGQPVAGGAVGLCALSNVVVNGVDAKYQEGTMCDSNGYFNLTGLPMPGLYSLTAGNAEFAMETNVVVRRGEDLLIRAERQRANVDLCLRFAEGERSVVPFTGRCDMDRNSSVHITDGRARLSRMKYGQSQLLGDEFLKLGLWPENDGLFQVKKMDREISVYLKKAPELTVRVLDSDGKAVGGVRVGVGAGGTRDLNWVTDRQGVARGYVMPQEIAVQVVASQAFAKPVIVKAGDGVMKKEITITLGDMGRLVGRVTGRDSTNAIRGYVGFVDSDGREYNSGIRAGGFEIGNVPAQGGWLAVVAGPEWAPAVQNVKLAKKGTTELEAIVLERGVPVTFRLERAGVDPDARSTGFIVRPEGCVELLLILLPRKEQQVGRFGKGRYVVMGMENEKIWKVAAFEVLGTESDGVSVDLKWNPPVTGQ